MNFNISGNYLITLFYGYYQIEPVSEALISQWGASGAIIIAEALAIIWLYKQLTGRIKEKDAEISRLNADLRERLTESLKLVMETLNESSASVEKLATSINDLEKAIAIADRIDKLSRNK